MVNIVLVIIGIPLTIFIVGQIIFKEYGYIQRLKLRKKVINEETMKVYDENETEADLDRDGKLVYY